MQNTALPNSPVFHLLVKNCFFVVAYLLSAKAGLLLASNGYASPVWPPSGIAIALLILAGPKLLPGVFIGALLTNFSVDGSLGVALQIATGNTLEGLTALLLIRKLIGRRYIFNRLHSVLIFTLAVMVASSISAGIGSHAITDWLQESAAENFIDSAFIWWIGDCTGALIFTPLILAFTLNYRSPQRSNSEAILFCVSSIVIGLITFGGQVPVHVDGAFAFAPLLLLIGIGYRFGIRGTVLFVFLLSLLAIVGTQKGYGPFATNTQTLSLELIQLFIGCLALCGLMLCATISEREHQRFALLRFNNRLDQKVTRATLELRQNNLSLQKEQLAQKQLIQALQTSEARYRALLDHAAEAIVLYDPAADRFVDANANALLLFDLQRSELLNHGLISLSPVEQPDSRPSKTTLRSLFAPPYAEEVISFEWHLLNFQGRTFPCEIKFVNYPSDHQLLLRGSIVDISERMLIENEQRLASRVFANSTEAIMVTDAREKIIKVNQAFCDISGYSVDEILGKSPHFFASGRHSPAFFSKMWTELNQNGHWRGEIWDRRKCGEVYPKWLTISTVKDAKEQVTHYVAQFSDVTDFKATEERLRYLANYDHLTGLHNRSAFLEHLQCRIKDAQRETSHFSVFFIDLDGFKLINDSLGHDAGDELLIQVAQRLRNTLRNSDIIARLGGDEFTVLAKESATDPGQLASKLLASMTPAFQIQRQSIHLSASIGISSYPHDGIDEKALVKNADVAMYTAKQKGRNQYCLFTQQMDSNALNRLNLEIELRRAIEQREFVLFYQPQICLQSGLLIGLEALIRWQHPERGLLSPAVFIEVAEQTGLIIPIGNWVLQEACRQNRQWQLEAGFHIPVAVNLSARQFCNPMELLNQVAQGMFLTGLESRYLELELTESMLIDDAEEALETLSQLRKLGCLLSIDDFGTGYSSLSYLKRFHADKLKIDRSFITDLTSDPDNRAIVDATIALGHSLGLEVIAEGVETKAQQAMLCEKGCDQIQGYLVSPPVASDKVASMANRFGTPPHTASNLHITASPLPVKNVVH